MQKISPVENVKKFIQYYIGHVRFRYRYVDYEPGQWSVWVTMTHERYAQAVLDKSIVEVQIELRKLESMTEEEASDVYTIERDTMLHSPTNDVDVRRVNGAWQIVRLDIVDTILWVVDDGVIYKVTEDNGKPMIEYTRNMPLIFDYLLSRGFDLFGLIDAGLAH